MKLCFWRQPQYILSVASAFVRIISDSECVMMFEERGLQYDTDVAVKSVGEYK
jgi:hypothetical protein